MAEENTSKIKKIENCFDTNPQEMTMSEEGSVRRVIVKEVGNVEDVISLALKDQGECVSKSKEVPKPSRRHSTGWIGKLEVKSRYRGNHHVPSTHELCKHGKNLRDDDAVKPWKVVRRRSVEEGSEVVKVEAGSGLNRRRSLGSLSRQIPAGTKPESSAVVKRDALALMKKPCASVNSETSSVKEERNLASSVDGSSVRSNDKPRKNKGTETTLSGGGSAVVKNVLGLGSEKSSSNVYTPKSLKNKEKAKTQTISSGDVKENTVCVVEASVVKGEKQASSSEKKTMRSRLKSLTTPTKRGSAYHSPTKHVPGTSLTKKKESGDAELVAKKIRPTKKTGVKVTLAKQLSYKKGKKTLEPKFEELETQTEGREKKTLKAVKSKSVSCEGSKREKVVLRRRKVEGRKKRMTLFNSVIEETMNKLINVRKTKVKALIGAFETVISLQDTKTPQSKAATSTSES